MRCFGRIQYNIAKRKGVSMQLFLRYIDNGGPLEPKPPRFTDALAIFQKQFDCHTFVNRRQGDRLELSFSMLPHLTTQLQGRVVIDGGLGYIAIAIEARQGTHTEKLDVCGLVRLCRMSQSEKDSYSLKVHPIQGHMSIWLMASLPLPLPNHYELLDLVEGQLASMRKQLLIKLEKIKSLRTYASWELVGSSQNRRERPPARQALEEMKKYVISSVGYAWNTAVPKQGAPEDKNTMKRQFRDRYARSTILPNNICLEALMTGADTATEKFFLMTSGQDNFAELNYLVREEEALEEDSQVQELKLRQEQLNELARKQSAVLEDGTTLRLRRLRSKAAEREIAVVMQLPSLRYPTLPVYYQNNQLAVEAGEKCIITSEPPSCLYTQYLKRNSAVLTLDTMLFLLNELARTLLYLRNHEIVSNSLIPSEVRVACNLKLHIDCLKNAYHPAVDGRSAKSKRRERSLAVLRNDHLEEPPPNRPTEDNSPFRNNLPYVSHTHLGHFYCHQSELSDVYSFGLIMFRTLFGRNLFDIKRTTLDRICEFDAIKIMSQHKRVFALERLNRFSMDHMKLLANFALQTGCHHAPGLFDAQLQPTESFNSMLTSHRPYLDWVVIIVECTMQFFQRQYQL